LDIVQEDTESIGLSQKDAQVEKTNHGVGMCSQLQELGCLQFVSIDSRIIRKITMLAWTLLPTAKAAEKCCLLSSENRHYVYDLCKRKTNVWAVDRQLFSLWPFTSNTVPLLYSHQYQYHHAA